MTTGITVGDLGHKSVVVGEDTDLLILMTALAKPDTDIKMLIPENKNRQNHIFSSKTIQNALGDMTANLLFLHAVTGYDTTSASYRKGKHSPFNILKQDHSLQHKVEVFNGPQASADYIAEAGEPFLLAIYGVKTGGNLDLLRYHLYLRTIVKQPEHARFDLATLPPNISCSSPTFLTCVSSSVTVGR